MSLYDESDEHPTSIISLQVIESLQWCLRIFVRQDEAMAAAHLSNVVHYSPVTISVAYALHDTLAYQPLNYWPPGTQEMVDEVLSSAAIFDSPGPPPPG